ncbi:hypothetical protein [Altericista sp. CCNU0014]|uniref:hypothetical protein n=1 Tax=Altericista sp. CCNU0014 TaxID=3082949 RepID=UPI00384C0F4C
MMKPTNDSEFIAYDLAAFQQDDKAGLLDVLRFLYDEDSDWEMPKSERDEFNYRRLVIARFIQKEINSRFKMKELNRKWTKVVDPEVELWRKTLTMLERLHTLGFLPRPHPHPVIALLALIKEKALLMCNFSLTEYEIEGINGKEDAIAMWKRQNRQIQAQEINPFGAEHYPHTWQILNVAQKVAEESNQFCRSYFTPVVRARMTVVARIDDSQGKLRYKGKIIRQGKSVSEIRKKEAHNTETQKFDFEMPSS